MSPPRHYSVLSAVVPAVTCQLAPVFPFRSFREREPFRGSRVKVSSSSSSSCVRLIFGHRRPLANQIERKATDRTEVDGAAASRRAADGRRLDDVRCIPMSSRREGWPASGSNAAAPRAAVGVYRWALISVRTDISDDRGSVSRTYRTPVGRSAVACPVSTLPDPARRPDTLYIDAFVHPSVRPSVRTWVTAARIAHAAAAATAADLPTDHCNRFRAWVTAAARRLKARASFHSPVCTSRFAVLGIYFIAGHSSRPCPTDSFYTMLLLLLLHSRITRGWGLHSSPAATSLFPLM